MAGTAGDEIVGRTRELEQVHAFLGPTGFLPGALMLEGEAGIGKSTLWSAGVEWARAAGFRVLVSRPAGSEVALSYAVLGDLLEPVLDHALEPLSPPRRRALEVALLLETVEGPPPDARAVAVALLGSLRALAVGGPVVLAIDDVQWVDPPSAFALEFALRRLRDEPVAVLASRRLGLDGGLEPPGAERLEVGPLSVGATHRLVTNRLGVSFARPVLLRLHAASGGNPFYALELARAFVRREGDGRPGAPVQIPEDLAGLVRERLALLSPSGRSVAAAVAALAAPTIESALRAGNGDRASLEDAIAIDVLELDGERVRFTHPLLAAGAYNDLWPPDRRALHARLAEAADDAEERARHLALAADGPDAAVAAALDEAVRVASGRAARAAASELAELAILSTPPDAPGELRRRRLAAAEAHASAGDVAAARPLLELVLPELDGLERSRAQLLLAQISHEPATLDLLTEALESADDRLAAEIKLELIGWRHSEGGLAAACAEGHSAVESARRSGDRMLVALAVVAAAFMDAMAGERTDLEALAEAVRVEEEQVAWASSAYLPGTVLGLCLMFVDRLDEARGAHEAALARAVANENELGRQYALYHLAECEARAGRFDRAAECAELSLEAAEQIGQPPEAPLYLAALADTYRGRVAEARLAAERAIAAADEYGDRPFSAQCRGGLGFLELSLGNAAAADALLRPLWAEISSMGYREPSVFPVLPNAIDAMIRVGELGEAEAQLAELEHHGRRLDSAWALAQAARCRGLLASASGDIDAAEAHFERALAEHNRLPSPFERARTLLALGAARRRAKRRNAAREPLNAALALFEELGSPLWSAQVRAELASLGGRRPSDGGLTPTERRVAELAAEGLSTKQVAAALVVSPKTVEGHLSRIYAKLGITSRTQLARRLADN